jgi:hypothetical protein
MTPDLLVQALAGAVGVGSLVGALIAVVNAWKT